MPSEFLVNAIHHLGIATPSIEKAASAYSRILGIKLITDVITDEYHKVKVAFAGSENGPLIEFVEPLGEDSPVHELVKRGTSSYHLCFSVTDIDAAVQHARNSGALVVSLPYPAMAFKGKRIAFVFMPDKTLVEFLEQEGP